MNKGGQNQERRKRTRDREREREVMERHTWKKSMRPGQNEKLMVREADTEVKREKERENRGQGDRFLPLDMTFTF